MDTFVRDCDVIVHLAGQNRGSDAEVEETNPALAKDLVEALMRTGRRPQVLFASSIHVDRDTAYGRSKRKAADILSHWARQTETRFCNLVLPHVYGEHGRPFYNSVVSTFCYQLATGDEPGIDVDRQLKLLHAQDVAELILSAIRVGTSGELKPDGVPIRLNELLARLRRLSDKYLAGVIPEFKEPLDLRLFNTFRSYLFPRHYPVFLKLFPDDRGALFEAVKTAHGGQAFLSTTRPGVTRGDHFHFNKVERFLVVRGEAEIRLRRCFQDTVTKFHVSGKTPCFIDIPTLHAHNISNVGKDELLTFFWSHEIYEAENPDTCPEPVDYK
jgi:UDP-2-acetamido-2,6-beta-L-arabino-hexul-4-ose reductase